MLRFLPGDISDPQMDIGGRDLNVVLEDSDKTIIFPSSSNVVVPTNGKRRTVRKYRREGEIATNCA